MTPGIDEPRIIPARAGSRLSTLPDLGGRTDHPRACGEQYSNLNGDKNGGGSSPRVRGAVGRRGRVREHLGIIPARAGSSTDVAASTTYYQDHPRACGEQVGEHVAARVGAGSSPRVRGAAVKLTDARVAEGIIPARAGSRTRKAMR